MRCEFGIGDVVAPVGRSRPMLVVDIEPPAFVTCSWEAPPGKPREYRYHVSALRLLRVARF